MFQRLFGGTQARETGPDEDQKLFNSIDVDQDGKITRDEFARLMNQPENAGLLGSMASICSQPDARQTSGYGQQAPYTSFTTTPLAMGAQGATHADRTMLHLIRSQSL